MGASRATTREQSVTVLWPSICAGPIGRRLGQLYMLRAGVRIGPIPLTIGWLLVLLTAPLAALLYLSKKAPRRPFVLVGPINPDSVCYRITTQRVLIEHPLEKNHAPVAQLPLDAFDGVEMEVLPGQAWFDAADVVLTHEQREVLRLRGVGRPEPFVRTLLKTQQAWAIARDAAPAA